MRVSVWFYTDRHKPRWVWQVIGDGGTITWGTRPTREEAEAAGAEWARNNPPV